MRKTIPTVLAGLIAAHIATDHEPANRPPDVPTEQTVRTEDFAAVPAYSELRIDATATAEAARVVVQALSASAAAS
jgi:hypothetical protein